MGELSSMPMVGNFTLPHVLMIISPMAMRLQLINLRVIRVDRSFVAVDSKFFDENIFYVALSRGRDASQIYSATDFLGSLSDQDVAYLKALEPERSRGEYFRHYRQKLADIIKGSSEKSTSQDHFSKAQLQSRSRSEVLKDAMRKLERTLAPAKKKVSERVRRKSLGAFAFKLRNLSDH